MIKIRYLGEFQQIDDELSLEALLLRVDDSLQLSGKTLDEIIAEINAFDAEMNASKESHEFTIYMNQDGLAELLMVDAETIPLLLSEVIIEERSSTGVITFVASDAAEDEEVQALGDSSNSDLLLLLSE